VSIFCSSLPSTDDIPQIEQNTFEFRDPKLERLVGLTAADRKWIDEIVKDVNETWNEADPSRPTSMQFRGSEDYLRTKFEEYVSAALSSVKYADFLARGNQNGVLISDGDTGVMALNDFNAAWIADFRTTNAFEVWNRVTDPTLFDIVEPKHPCPQKPSAVADISLRLQEGLMELKLDQQLAPTKEALSNAFAVGSANVLKAVEGVRGRWAASRTTSSQGVNSPAQSASSRASTPVEITKADVPENGAAKGWSWAPKSPPPQQQGLRPLSLAASHAAVEAKAAVGTWGANIGSFFATRAQRFSQARSPDPGSPAGENERPAAAAIGGSSGIHQEHLDEHDSSEIGAAH